MTLKEQRKLQELKDLTNQYWKFVQYGGDRTETIQKIDRIWDWIDSQDRPDGYWDDKL